MLLDLGARNFEQSSGLVVAISLGSCRDASSFLPLVIGSIARSGDGVTIDFNCFALLSSSKLCSGGGGGVLFRLLDVKSCCCSLDVLI